MSQDQASNLLDLQTGSGLLPDLNTYTVKEDDVFITWPSARTWLRAHAAVSPPGSPSTAVISNSHHDTYTTHEDGVYVVWPSAKAYHLANAASIASATAALSAPSLLLAQAEGFHTPSGSSTQSEPTEKASPSSTRGNFPTSPPLFPTSSTSSTSADTTTHPPPPFPPSFFAHYNHSLPIAFNTALQNYGAVSSLPEFHASIGTHFAASIFFLKEGLNLVTTALGARIRAGTNLLDHRVWRQLRQAARARAPEGTLPEIHVRNAMRVLAGGWNEPIAALATLVQEFFTEGDDAASYAWCMLEMAVGDGKWRVGRYLIPGPDWFWSCAACWEEPKLAACLVMVLASPPDGVPAVMGKMGRIVGAGRGNGYAKMKDTPSESLTEAVQLARSVARVRGVGTVIGVHLCDVGFEALKLAAAEGHEAEYVTFEHWFVVGVCLEGIKVWQAGGLDDEGYSLNEHCLATGLEMVGWAKAEEFLANFEGLAVAEGSWNRKIFKRYERCFGINLRKKQQTKILPKKYEAWVELVKIENVTRQNLTKFTWN